jgi:hypothetical protein
VQHTVACPADSRTFSAGLKTADAACRSNTSTPCRHQPRDNLPLDQDARSSADPELDGQDRRSGSRQIRERDQAAVALAAA